MSSNRKNTGHHNYSRPLTHTGISSSKSNDCEKALRMLKDFDDKMENPNQPLAEKRYFLRSSERMRSTMDIGPTYPAEIQAALDAIRKFIGQVIQTSCHKCGTKLMTDFSVDSLCKQWQSIFNLGETASICAAQCADPHCRAITCLGCKYEPQTGVSKAIFDGLVIDWCCEDGCLFGFWVFLAKYDLLEMNAQAKTTHQAHRRRSGSTSGKRGTGYGVGFYDELSEDLLLSQAGDTGQAHYAKRDSRSPQAVDVRDADAETDQVTTIILGLTSRLLPHLAKPGKPAPTCLPAMLTLSLLCNKVAELLRNDSLRDVEKRGCLYEAVFDFIERLVCHPDLAYLIHQERYPKKKTAGLEVLSRSPEQKHKQGASGQEVLILGYTNDGMLCSLAASMTNLVTQSQNFLKSYKAMNKVPGGRSGRAMFDIANRVTALQMLVAPHSSIKLHGENIVIEKDLWVNFCKENGVVWESGISGQLCHNASEIALGLQHSTRNRIKRLVAEASEMSTSLPPNIFVKVDDSRPDVMKCLIIGPDDTPYQGGVFEFDLVCKSEYPNVPPNVDFRTTGGGTVGFNPNLYPRGKVCLSLLGTWTGSPEEQWQPGKSTLLSVLVSIQAMIFCENPWENEPGENDVAASSSGRAVSETYNQQIQCLTTRYAILDWLREPTMRDSVWSHILTQYFNNHGEKIMQKARTWAVSNPNMTGWKSSVGRVNLVEELAAALGFSSQQGQS